MQIGQNAKVLNINNTKYSILGVPIENQCVKGRRLLYGGFTLFIFGILHFITFVFCHFYILSHLYFVIFVFCHICILSHLYCVTFVFCHICILSHLYFVPFVFCPICILSHLYFVVFPELCFDRVVK